MITRSTCSQLPHTAPPLCVHESVYIFRTSGWQLLVQVEPVVSHLVNCRLQIKPSSTLLITINHDEENVASCCEGIPTHGAMSRDGPVMDKLGAIPSVDGKISIKASVVTRFS